MFSLLCEFYHFPFHNVDFGQLSLPFSFYKQYEFKLPEALLVYSVRVRFPSFFFRPGSFVFPVSH